MPTPNQLFSQAVQHLAKHLRLDETIELRVQRSPLHAALIHETGALVVSPSLEGLNTTPHHTHLESLTHHLELTWSNDSPPSAEALLDAILAWDETTQSFFNQVYDYLRSKGRKLLQAQNHTFWVEIAPNGQLLFSLDHTQVGYASGPRDVADFHDFLFPNKVDDSELQRLARAKLIVRELYASTKPGPNRVWLNLVEHTPLI